VGRSAADGLAFLLRHFLMNDRITLPFALTSIAFAGLFLRAWRIAFLVWHTQRQQHLQSLENGELRRSV